MSVSERNSLLFSGATQIVHLLRTSGIIAQSLTVKWLSTRCNKSVVARSADYHTLRSTCNFIACAAVLLLSSLDSRDVLCSFTLNMSISDGITTRRRTAVASTSSGKPSKPSTHIYYTATRYGLEGPRFESRWGRDCSHPFSLALEATQPPVQLMVPGLVFRG
jgi:hypothetical protein